MQKIGSLLQTATEFLHSGKACLGKHEVGEQICKYANIYIYIYIYMKDMSKLQEQKISRCKFGLREREES